MRRITRTELHATRGACITTCAVLQCVGMARSLRTGETAPIAVRLPADKLSQLDELAERTGRTRSEVIREAIDATIETNAA